MGWAAVVVRRVHGSSKATKRVWLPSARRCDGLGSIVIRIQEWPAWADNERDRLRLDRVGGRVR
ncbi:hypothetical protein XANMN_03360 [Xanthomonas phaseoli pv. manihotis str. CIO151]|nr:hypothetical protein XANMN_03360 [Xanthomonas phaseoli pv. manihotis str. CIO151]